MKRFLIFIALMVPLATIAERVDFTGDGSNGFVTGESVTAANMNEINTAVDDNADDIDALEAVDAAFPGDNIVDGSIDSSELAVNSVGAAELQANSVFSSELSDNAVTTAKIFNGTITVDDMGSNSVNTTQLITNAVTNAKMADNAIGNAEMADDAIGAAEMADGDHGDVAWASGVASVEAVADNAVLLSTDTIGNYVATIADSGAGEVTVANSGSEGAAVTLALASGVTRDTELNALTTTTSDPTDGSDACATGDMWLNTDGRTIFFCVDGSTDLWWGVNLSDAP